MGSALPIGGRGGPLSAGGQQAPRARAAASQRRAVQRRQALRVARVCRPCDAVSCRALHSAASAQQAAHASSRPAAATCSGWCTTPGHDAAAAKQRVTTVPSPPAGTGDTAALGTPGRRARRLCEGPLLTGGGTCDRRAPRNEQVHDGRVPQRGGEVHQRPAARAGQHIPAALHRPAPCLDHELQGGGVAAEACSHWRDDSNGQPSVSCAWPHPPALLRPMPLQRVQLQRSSSGTDDASLHGWQPTRIGAPRRNGRALWHSWPPAKARRGKMQGDNRGRACMASSSAASARPAATASPSGVRPRLFRARPAARPTAATSAASASMSPALARAAGRASGA